MVIASCCKQQSARFSATFTMSYNPLAAQNTQTQARQQDKSWNPGPSEGYAYGPASARAPPSPGAAGSYTSYRTPDLPQHQTLQVQQHLPPRLVQLHEQQQTGSAPSALNKQYNPLLQQVQHNPQPSPAALPGVLAVLAAGRDTRSTSHASSAQQLADPWGHAGTAPGAVNSAANTDSMKNAALQWTNPAHQLQELSLEARAGELQRSPEDLSSQQDAHWPAASNIQQRGTPDTAISAADANDPWAAVLYKPQGKHAGGQAAASAAMASHTTTYDSMQLGGNPKGAGAATVSWEAVMASSAAVPQLQQGQRSTPPAAATNGWESSDVSLVAAAAAAAPDSCESVKFATEPHAAARAQQQHWMSAGAGTANWEAVMASSRSQQAAAHVPQQRSGRGAAGNVSENTAGTGSGNTFKALTGPQSAAHAQQHGTAPAAGGGAAAAAAQSASRSTPKQSPRQAEETNVHAGNGVIEMALTQLRHERPDVAMHTTKELRAKISAMSVEFGLAAVGELAELPQGWADGLGMIAGTARGGKASSWVAHKQQQKSAATKHLEGVVARAAAHAQASGSSNKDNKGAEGRQAAGNWGSYAADDGGTGGFDGWEEEQTAAGDEKGWVTIPTAGSSPAGGGSSSSSVASRKGGVTAATLRAAVGAAADGSGRFAWSEGSRSTAGRHVVTAWAKLKSERPDVVMHLDERHRKSISNLSKDKQVQVLAILCSLNSGQVDSRKPRADIAKNLTMAIGHYLRMLEQTDSSEVTAGLKKIVQKHPHLVPYMDDQFCSRIAALNHAEALIALDALDKAGHDANASWQQRCTNHSAWLMRAVTNALRAAGH